MPSIRHYSSTSELYWTEIVKKVMAWNRFEILLKVWHFTNNDNCPPRDRLYKIEPFVEKLNEKFQAVYIPGETICVDESLIPYRERLIMRQYIPQKTHKYGIKTFKLCCDNGYTYKTKVYGGKEKNPTVAVPTKVVLNLSKNLLYAGRTIITDNYYTSL